MDTKFEDALHQTLGIPAAHSLEMAASFKTRYLNKNDAFPTGVNTKVMGFVQSGIIREYFVDEQGREITKWVATPGYFIMDIAHFLFNQPARWQYQALTDCQLQVLSKEDYDNIKQRIQAWDEIENLLLAKCFVILENRIVGHLSLTSEERFYMLFSQQPELFNLVPLKFIASMLGMTPETLSRVRKKYSQLTS